MVPTRWKIEREMIREGIEDGPFVEENSGDNCGALIRYRDVRFRRSLLLQAPREAGRTQTASFV